MACGLPSYYLQKANSAVYSLCEASRLNNGRAYTKGKYLFLDQLLDIDMEG